MHVLHLTAHLGGGVGKAHAALRAAMPAGIRQTYLLLEQPRDRRYADEVAAFGGDVVFARDIEDIAGYCADADIVQVEFWNHPKLFECLARVDFPAMRSVFWSHVSGLFRPVIAPGFFAAADRFVFTTPASMVLGEGASHLCAIGSGFGFTDVAVAPAIPPSVLPDISPSGGEIDSRPAIAPTATSVFEREVSAQPISPLEGEMPGRAEGGEPQSPTSPITYLGTIDFIKLHPGIFDAIDALRHDTTATIWGAHDPQGAVAAKARTMRHPGRIRFMGQTADPQGSLAKSRIFFYPLQPDHYGTAENALIEAMSLGLVPVVLANPAECAIIDHGVTGFVASSIEECTAILDALLDAPEDVARVSTNAAKAAAEKFTPEKSAAAFVDLWKTLVVASKHVHDFKSITGNSPLDWYLTTQFLPGDKIVLSEVSAQQSKGTLAHFRSAFPDDPCWTGI